ncbi:MAG: hypothetical protein ACOY0T_08020 [Myxococcota bacterium]
MLPIDPLKLDRTLERYARLSTRFRAALRTSDAVEHAFELRPRELDAEPLAELTSLTERDPLAKPLLQWAEELVQRHACIEAERRVAHAFYREAHPIEAPAQVRASIAQLLHAALKDPALSAAWLGALERHAGALQSARFELWETRARTALTRSVQPPPSTELRDAANTLLTVTRDAASAFGARSLADWLSLALGRDAVGEYPTRLTARNLMELLGDSAWLHGLEPELVGLPALLGSSSLMRGFSALGAALHAAAAGMRRPFVLHHDPRARRESVFAALFGLLPLQRTFAERRLSVARARLRDHERSSGRVLLLSARTLALRALLAEQEPRGTSTLREAFVELTHASLGFELAPTYAGVLFTREHAEVELVGFLLALVHNAELTDRHDEDWFRNPRAIAELRAHLETPPSFELDAKQLARGVELLQKLVTSSL